MAVFTPRGLKLRLSTEYVFALIARVYPRTDAFNVLQLTEAVENLVPLASVLAGVTAFALKLSPSAVAVVVCSAGTVLHLVHLFGLFVPPVHRLLSVARVYGYVSGWGVLTAGLVVFGYLSCGWKGVAGYFIGRFATFVVGEVGDLIWTRAVRRDTGAVLTGSERSFFHAFRLEANRLGASTHLAVSDAELDEANWGPVLADLAIRWPEVVARFTRGRSEDHFIGARPDTTADT